MHKIAINFLILLIFFSACSVFRPANSVSEAEVHEITLDTVMVESRKNQKAEMRKNPYTNYQATAQKVHELLHTKLDLSFDIPNEWVFGKAEITLKPHFYSVDSVVLDARGFDIHKTALMEQGGKISDLKHNYDGKKLIIYNRELRTRNDTFTLFIDYTAKPSLLSGGGSWAIRENRGMYFQDSQSDNPQIWTQGEPEANSGWFPTIDKPNQHMTQEIFLTVDRDFETLSNGAKVNVLLNDDGTKTVHWKQEKPHTPYLAAVIVGRFDIIKYHWRDKPVYVYIEAGDAEKAKPTFRKSADMMTFFSHKFQYDYPWEKYSQVVVRNFISGAMENTGATVYSDYFLSDPNKEIYRPGREITVAHELSHHWFGNLVTCESWANLPLNEAFASYAEYLWLEHEYGRFTADRHLINAVNSYYFEASYKNKDLIRYYHNSPGSMFDMHSYNKGAAILHMLRYEVGDEAFFESLAHYLKKHEYQSTEVHDLRLAFEEVTGRDLNYFFNAWFLNKGYLELDIEYRTSDSLNWEIHVEQMQKESRAPLYKHKVPADIYFNDTIIRKELWLDKQTQVFNLSFPRKAKFVKFDAENSLLCKKTENRSKEDYLFILQNVANYKDQNEAIMYLEKSLNKKSLIPAYMSLLESPYYYFRNLALKIIPLKKNAAYYSAFIEKVREMADKDPDPLVRKTAKAVLEKE